MASEGLGWDHPCGHCYCVLGAPQAITHMIWSNYSDLTRPHPKWWFSKGIPIISGKSRLVKYYNLARYDL